MSESCRLSPVVFRRKGTKIEEVPSKLFADIKEAVGDYDTSWKMWAYTQTKDFKDKYKELEYDELGEVTFPSLLKALSLTDVYNDQKKVKEVMRDYGFANRSFSSPREVVDQINAFNSKEKNYIALVVKDSNNYKINVVPRTAISIDNARQQSLNNALSKEILNFLHELGFNVEVLEDPKFNGLFDPTSTSFQNGMLNIIRIARGEKGEEALPEEFSHMLIEGLAHIPLVQRLLATIDDQLVKDVLGSQYGDYYEKYEGSSLRLKKEVAGKMLASHIKKKGTIIGQAERKNLLERIWQWAKNIFSKITNNDLDYIRLRADEYVSGIYNMVSSGEAVPMIDKHSILSGEQLYSLHQEFKDKSVLADKALTILGKKAHLEAMESMDSKSNSETAKAFYNIKEAIERDKFEEGLSIFLADTEETMKALIRQANYIKSDEENLYTSGIKEINRIAKVCRKIDLTMQGYDRLIRTLATLDNDDMMATFSVNKNDAERIASQARIVLNYMNSLTEFRRSSTINILYNASRTVIKQDIVRGVGKRKDEMMSLEEIIKHAQEDINFVDRWLTAMSDASDEYLVIMDSLVKAQQYERDIEIQEKQEQIAIWDEELRKAGYSSDFMFEMKDDIPTGRLISPYDWDSFNKERKEYAKFLREVRGLEGQQFYDELSIWENSIDTKTGFSRLVKLYVNPEDQARAEQGLPVSPTAIFERVPNPKLYDKNVKVIENLAPEQKLYYNRMIALKREMMGKIPHRGQGIYKAIYISKGLIEGILDNSTGDPLKATLDYCKRQFQRRPDDIGFGMDENFESEVKELLQNEKDPKTAADKVFGLIRSKLDDDIVLTTKVGTLKSIIKKNINDIDTAAKEILEQIASENFYTVDTDFADQKIKRLPVYYSRKLKDMKMLSTDFTSSILAYTAMAINYEKMNEVVDILEIARDYSKERAVLMKEGTKSMMGTFNAFGKVFRAFVERSGNGTNISGRMDDFMDAVVYEERKINEGTWNIGNLNLDQAKTLDFIKDYTGLLGLGLNIFSTISNISVGKVQQWIESLGGEYFTVKDYAKAIGQYTELIPGCVAEMASPVKKNKLSLLIRMFDPMGDYYSSLRDTSSSMSAVVRVLGNNALAYIGMNAGEHLLHCQTMLAMLNHIKLINSKNEEISLYDALQVVTDPETGITRLELMKGLSYKKDIIGKNGRPELDENGKIKSELVSLDDKGNYNKYVIRQKRRIRKVNDTLNGAFSENDKGAAHRRAVLRLVLQFRQWMPAHYERRFGKTHYDDDLEQWRTGYYRTLTTFTSDLIKDIRKGQLELTKSWNTLNEHEKANMRRAMSEISFFILLRTLVMMGGRVKDRDRSWLDKMALYQINRMYLEIGASMPFNGAFFSNIFQLLNSPIASINTFERFSKVLQLWNVFDEVKTGRYEGWSEWERDAFTLLPGVPQIVKAVDFDDSMFAMFENDN